MFAHEIKFLVVDDFATVRRILKKALMDLGYTHIIEADEGQSAWVLLEAAAKQNKLFEFVISDLSMPGLTGVELLAKIRAHPRMKTTPFLLVTAESEQNQILQVLRAGANDYLVKPFNGLTLKAKLEVIYHHLQGQAS